MRSFLSDTPKCGDGFSAIGSDAYGAEQRRPDIPPKPSKQRKIEVLGDKSFRPIDLTLLPEAE